MTDVTPTRENEMETIKIIHAVTMLVRGGMLAALELPNSCIETSRLGKLVFDKLGIPCRVQPVRVAAFNGLAWNLYQGGMPFEMWPENAYSLGIGWTDAQEAADDTDGWNGHLVVVVRHNGQRHMIDMSADQMRRPGKLEINGPVGMVIENLWSPEDPLYRIIDNGELVIEYRPFSPVDPIGQQYLDSPAWNNDPAWFESAANKTIEALKESGIVA